MLLAYASKKPSATNISETFQTMMEQTQSDDQLTKFNPKEVTIASQMIFTIEDKSKSQLELFSDGLIKAMNDFKPYQSDENKTLPYITLKIVNSDVKILQTIIETFKSKQKK